MEENWLSHWEVSKTKERQYSAYDLHFYFVGQNWFQCGDCNWEGKGINFWITIHFTVNFAAICLNPGGGGDEKFIFMIKRSKFYLQQKTFALPSQLVINYNDCFFFSEPTLLENYYNYYRLSYKWRWE